MQGMRHTKQCSKCKRWLPYGPDGDFYPDRTRDGYDRWCKKCQSERMKTRDRAKMRDRQLRTKFGITARQYDEMLEEQCGVCKVCKKPETQIDPRSKKGAIKLLCVDHDHKTGDVRALLCQKCNVSLGNMEENPERIRALADYAEWCQTRETNVKIVQGSLFEREAS